jgi:hypothetical protein
LACEDDLWHLPRLRHATELLRGQRKIAASAQPVLLLFSGAGFTDELISHAAHGDGAIHLVDLDRLYAGS